MSETGTGTVQLGELIVAAFDEAAMLGVDPARVSFVAAGAVEKLLRAQPGVARRIDAVERAMARARPGSDTQQAE